MVELSDDSARVYHNDRASGLLVNEMPPKVPPSLFKGFVNDTTVDVDHVVPKETYPGIIFPPILESIFINFIADEERCPSTFEPTVVFPALPVPIVFEMHHGDGVIPWSVSPVNGPLLFLLLVQG